MSSSVLITGATGFIGRALCDKLVQEGWTVRAAVRGTSGTMSLPKEVDTVAVGELGPHTEWKAALVDVQCGVHLAARTHVTHDRSSDPLQEYRCVNVLATDRLARQAADAGVRRLVYLSSIKVNGEGGPESYSESMTPHPGDHYGTTKLEAELLLHEVSRAFRLEIVILRPPLIYGPGVKANFLSLLRAVDRGM